MPPNERSGVEWPEARALWRRLDAPGHDACLLQRDDPGWRLEGTAVFLEADVPALLAYTVTCDPLWSPRNGRVRGWVGDRPVDLTAVRTGEGWTLNGGLVPGLEGCSDVDLGFTPATNVFPVRRLMSTGDEAADVSAAWLDVTAGTLEPLSQLYERRGPEEFWYEAPRFGYAARLEVTSSGFVRRYPGLWELEGRTLLPEESDPDERGPGV